MDFGFPAGAAAMAGCVTFTFDDDLGGFYCNLKVLELLVFTFLMSINCNSRQHAALLHCFEVETETLDDLILV